MSAAKTLTAMALLCLPGGVAIAYFNGFLEGDIEDRLLACFLGVVLCLIAVFGVCSMAVMAVIIVSAIQFVFS